MELLHPGTEPIPKGPELSIKMCVHARTMCLYTLES